MLKKLIIIIFLFLASIAQADKIDVNGTNVNFKIRESDFTKGYDKLNLFIEIQLVNKRLPTKIELAYVSRYVLKSQPKAKMKWVFFLLPKMKVGSGAYATDHRIPEPEGIHIIEFGLHRTPYQYLCPTGFC